MKSNSDSRHPHSMTPTPSRTILLSRSRSVLFLVSISPLPFLRVLVWLLRYFSFCSLSFPLSLYLSTSLSLSRLLLPGSLASLRATVLFSVYEITRPSFMKSKSAPRLRRHSMTPTPRRTILFLLIGCRKTGKREKTEKGKGKKEKRKNKKPGASPITARAGNMSFAPHAAVNRVNKALKQTS